MSAALPVRNVHPGPGMILLREGLHHRRRVVRRIDADRIEEDVLAHPIAEQLLHLRETRGLERTGELAARVDQLDRDRPALDQIVETNVFAVLRRQLDVGEVVAVPARTAPRLATRVERQRPAAWRRARRAMRCLRIVIAGLLRRRQDVVGIDEVDALRRRNRRAQRPQVRRCRRGSMSHRSSIALSSCTVLWQCSM